MRGYNIRLIAIILITALMTVSLSAVERMVIRFESPDRETVERFTQPGIDVASHRPGDYLDIVATDEDLQEIREMGYDPLITQTEAELKQNIQLRTRTIPGYRTYDDVLAELQYIADEYPEITRLYNIGDSWGKIYTDNGIDYYEEYYFDIWALKLTSYPDSLMDKPAVFYDGAHHAREPLSTEVTMDFLNLLLDRYDADDEKVTFLIDNTEIWFIPLVNPDGHKVVLDRTDVWWRKNIRDNNENEQFDTFNSFGRGIDGVDLNRNYPFTWREDDRVSQTTYPGPEPASEPEVQALLELYESRHFVAGITYHTYGEMVLFPYGYERGCRAPDHEILQDLAEEMAVTIPKLSGAGHYDPMQSLDFYPVRGASDDHLYGQEGIFCYTFELATRFIPPPEEVEQVSQDNMEAAMILLNRVHHSTLTGIITDVVTGKPVEAEVFVKGIDDTGSFREPYRSRKPFGRYYRMLLPGEHKVVFSSEGYAATDTMLVNIKEDKQTELNVEMYPLMLGNISGKIIDFLGQEPVAGAEIKLKNSGIEPVYSNEQGYFIIEEVPYSPYEMRVSADDYGTVYKQLEVITDKIDYKIDLYPVFFADTFENIDNWETNGAWGLTDRYAYTGDYSLADSPDGDYAAEVVSYAKLKEEIDLTNAYNASVTFMARYGLQTGNDFCYLQILPHSDNHGEWVNLAVFNGALDWDFYDIPLAEYCGQEVSLRFLFTSDEGPVHTGIYIDDFRVYVSSPELPADEETAMPVSFQLEQNYPNPFNIETNIAFTLTRQEHVELTIYDIAGRKVKSLINETLPSGRHNIIWNGKNKKQKTMGSGIYFYRLQSREETSVRKMLLLK